MQHNLHRLCDESLIPVHDLFASLLRPHCLCCVPQVLRLGVEFAAGHDDGKLCFAVLGGQQQHIGRLAGPQGEMGQGGYQQPSRRSQYPGKPWVPSRAINIQRNTETLASFVLAQSALSHCSTYSMLLHDGNVLARCLHEVVGLCKAFGQEVMIDTPA